MSIEDDLKPTVSDQIHSVVSFASSIASSIIPGGSELFNLLVDKPINTRRDQWIIELEKRLRFLESHGLKIDDLQKNGEFISAVLYTSSIAIRNHSEEKRQSLLNAITNIVEILFNSIKKKVEEKDIKISLTQNAKEYIAKKKVFEDKYNLKIKEE